MGSTGGGEPVEMGDFGLSMSDIYFLLLADLSDVSDHLNRARSYASENQPRESWGSYLRAHKNRLKNSEDVHGMLKKNMMDAILKNMESAKILGEPLFTGHSSLELRSKLLERIKKDRCSIQKLNAELSQLENANNDLQRRTEEFQSMIAQRGTKGEMESTLKWQELKKKIQGQRAKYVKDIRYVTNQLCPESEVEFLLSEALKSSVSGGDPYVNVDGSSAEDIEFLLRCNIVVRHPHNRQLVRLCDLS